MKITKKVYKTAMGREVDMQTLQLINEKAVALGNAGLNARGDQVDARGNIIKKREELAQEYYRANPKAVRDEPLEEDNITENTTQQKALKKAKANKETEIPVLAAVTETDMTQLNEVDDAANAYAREIIKNKEK